MNVRRQPAILGSERGSIWLRLTVIVADWFSRLSGVTPNGAPPVSQKSNERSLVSSIKFTNTRALCAGSSETDGQNSALSVTANLVDLTKKANATLRGRVVAFSARTVITDFAPSALTARRLTNSSTVSSGNKPSGLSQSGTSSTTSMGSNPITGLRTLRRCLEQTITQSTRNLTKPAFVLSKPLSLLWGLSCSATVPFLGADADLLASPA